METPFYIKKHPKFLCKICDFICSKKGDYNRHLATQKHKWKQMETHFTSKNIKPTFLECSCGKRYKTRSGMWKHQTKCEIYEKDEKDEKDEKEDKEEKEHPRGRRCWGGGEDGRIEPKEHSSAAVCVLRSRVGRATVSGICGSVGCARLPLCTPKQIWTMLSQLSLLLALIRHSLWRRMRNIMGSRDDPRCETSIRGRRRRV